MALSAQQVKDMQSWYGTKADGIWGKNSTTAAGGRDAGSAYSLYASNKNRYSSYTDYMSYGGGRNTGSSSGGSQSSSTGSTGSLTTAQIKEMQSWYGTAADGIWGKNSTAAASGMGANAAYTMYLNNKSKYGSYSTMKNALNGGSQSSSAGSSGSTGGSSGGYSGGYTGSGYNNGGLTDAQIKEMQNYYGTAADGKWGQNSSAAAGGLSAADAWNRYQSSLTTPDTGGYDTGYDTGYDYSGPMSYSDYLQRVGGDDYQAAVQKAIEAQVQAATDQYNSQIENAGKDYEENARRAYINKMMSQRNMDQELAANGVYGGMADSQRIASETNYENDLTDLTNQYQATIGQLQQAITSAQLAGDAQAAEAMANYLSQVQAQYASYLQNERSIQAEIDMFNRQLAAQQAQEARAASYSGGSSGGSSGGYSGGYSGGGGYNNGGLTTAQIMEMQQALGVTTDGKWGSQSMAAADGMSAQEAWQAYQQANGSRKTGFNPAILGRVSAGAAMSGLGRTR